MSISQSKLNNNLKYSGLHLSEVQECEMYWVLCPLNVLHTLEKGYITVAIRVRIYPVSARDVLAGVYPQHSILCSVSRIVSHSLKELGRHRNFYDATIAGGQSLLKVLPL
jgi:hypothetical protein